MSKPKWEIHSIQFTGKRFYQVRVSGFNHYRAEFEDKSFSWLLPVKSLDSPQFDWTHAKWSGLESLWERYQTARKKPIPVGMQQFWNGERFEGF